MKKLPTHARDLETLFLSLFSPSDWDKGYLAPDMACQQYQSLSASIVQLRLSMPRLRCVIIHYAVDIPSFFLAMMGGSTTKHPGTVPAWPALQQLRLLGYYNNKQDKLLTDSEAKHDLFELVGNALAHFPDLLCLEIKIVAKPAPLQWSPNAFDDDDDDAYYEAEETLIAFCDKTPPKTVPDFPEFEPNEALLMVQGLDPRQYEVDVWKKVVLRERGTGLAVCVPDDQYQGWKRVDYGGPEEGGETEASSTGESGSLMDDETDTDYSDESSQFGSEVGYSDMD